MPSKKTYILLLFFIFSFWGIKTQAQSRIGRYRSGFKVTGNEVNFRAENANVRLSFCTSSMFRVQISWKRKFDNNEHWMVTKYQWPKVHFTTRENNKRFLIKTKKLNVIVEKSSMAIKVLTKNGKTIWSESMNGGGFKNGQSVKCDNILHPGEQFFGFGERMGFQDQRGKLVRLNVGRGKARSHTMGAFNVLKANYCPVPFFMSTRGYGIFFHNSFATQWDMGFSDPDQYSFKAKGGELDFYFIYGPKFPSIINQYTDITGKSPLMARFSMGLHVGTYSGGTWGHEKLASPYYVMNLGRKFRKYNIPADILWLDSTWRYFGKLGHAGTTFQWRSAFKNPKAMIDTLYAMHYHMVGVHIRPFLDNGTKYDLLTQAHEHHVTYPAKGMLGNIVDFFNQSAVNWWFNHAVKKVATSGVRFVKTDAGDSFQLGRDTSRNSGSTIKAVQRLHNLFPIAYARAPFEEFEKYNHMRGYNQTREGYAGIQRYPYIFAGDWPSRWQYFAPVIKAGLNIGLSGVGYWANCNGGFERKASQELYIRWTQFGMLSSVAMIFGMDHPGYKEPWNYGHKALIDFRKYDQMRYRLIPYIYTAAYKMYKTGMPLMRDLVMEYQNDPNVYHISNEYLFGPDMLVCPVTTKGAKSRVVYLPKGTWYNYWTGKKYIGKQYLTVPTPLMQMPIFIKAGSIIPRQKVMNYVGEYPVNWLNLSIYPKGISSYSIYDDDGTSMKYQQGDYALTKITCRDESKRIEIHINPPKGEYKVSVRTYELTLHSVTSPKDVRSNHGRLDQLISQKKFKSSKKRNIWFYDKNKNILYVKPSGNSKKEITVTVEK